MFDSHTETSVLLIGEGLRQMKQVVSTFNNVGIQILFADDAEEAKRVLFFSQPDFVLCQMRLPDADGAEFCRSMRANRALSRIPVMLVSETDGGVSGNFNALNSGADDLFAEEFAPCQFLAKVIWMIERRHAEDMRRSELAALRERQEQTLAIVRETSALLQNLADEQRIAMYDNARSDENQFSVEHRIEMGLTMIGGLANLLDEQVRALDLWENTAGRDMDDHSRSDREHRQSAFA